MEGWVGWPLERLAYLFLGAAFLVVWGQVTLYHWAAGFRSVYMWGPVLYTPVLVCVALFHGFYSGEAVGTVFAVAFGIGAAEGAFGIYKHLGGVRERVGGFNLRNFMTGPPVLLAVAYMALAVFGLLVQYWDVLAGTVSRPQG